jgi:hypothetical protein
MMLIFLSKLIGTMWGQEDQLRCCMPCSSVSLSFPVEIVLMLYVLNLEGFRCCGDEPCGNVRVLLRDV